MLKSWLFPPPPPQMSKISLIYNSFFNRIKKCPKCFENAKKIVGKKKIHCSGALPHVKRSNKRKCHLPAEWAGFQAC
jgi:hypothetical protein